MSICLSGTTLCIEFLGAVQIAAMLDMAQTRCASLWKAEHGVDLAEVLDAVAGVVLVRRQVRVDEEEGGAEEEEGGRHGALRPELHARTSVERVRLRHGTVPELDYWSYKK